jgi:hypothetical protein
VAAHRQCELIARKPYQGLLQVVAIVTKAAIKIGFLD